MPNLANNDKIEKKTIQKSVVVLVKKGLTLTSHSANVYEFIENHGCGTYGLPNRHFFRSNS